MLLLAHKSSQSNGRTSSLLTSLHMGNIGFLLLLLAPILQHAPQAHLVQLNPIQSKLSTRVGVMDGANYSAILTRPQAPGKYPAAFVIGGLGCYSFDNLNPGDAYYELLNGFMQHGFVIFVHAHGYFSVSPW
jgi:hypothetical protein